MVLLSSGLLLPNGKEISLANVANFFLAQSIGIHENNTFQLKFLF